MVQETNQLHLESEEEMDIQHQEEQEQQQQQQQQLHQIRVSQVWIRQFKCVLIKENIFISYRQGAAAHESQNRTGYKLF